MSLNIRDAVEPLGKFLSEDRLIVFAGSGISVDSGLPTWDGLLKLFIEYANTLRSIFPDDTELRRLVKDAHKRRITYPAQVASVLKQHIITLDDNTNIALRQGFSEWFARQLDGKPNEYHKAIVDTNYRHIITSNYDDLLEQAADELGHNALSLRSYTYKDVGKLSGAVFDRQSSIIHVHGKKIGIALDEIVFTSEDYQHIMKEQPGFRFVLGTLLSIHAVLFVGYGASDPHLEDILQELSHTQRWKEHPTFPHCFLTLPNEKSDAVYDSHKRSLQTEIITIESYDETLELLRNLQSLHPRKGSDDASP